MTTHDWIAEQGYLFLGSRLKRLAEQMQEDVSQVSQRAGMRLQPGQFPLLALLLERGAQTVGELARTMGLSQPVTTRNIGKLVEQGLVQIERSDADGRSKIVSLTAVGEQTIKRSRDMVWPHVEAAVRQVVEGLSGSLLEQIAAIERALMERPLAKRAAAIAAGELVPATDADIPALVALINRAYRGVGTASGWSNEAGYISGNRISEKLLRTDMAAAPAASLLIWRDGASNALKGCVWLEPLADETWYLGLLAVDTQRQKGGLGHSLLTSAEQWIGERGGKRVQMTVVNVRETLMAWYLRRGYQKTGEVRPFPYDDNRFGTPLRDDLSFIVLEKKLTFSGDSIKESS